MRLRNHKQTFLTRGLTRRVSLLLICITLCACAEIKQSGRIVGHTTRDVTREIGHSSRDIAREVAKGAKRVGKSVTEETP